MDITTSLEFLKSSPSNIVFLGWPVIALGYPLFASITAVSKDSKDQMRKLVMYWTLFSLFSLIEFAFVKIIEGIPYWSIARLVAICCLVLPQFEGSCLAYQGLARTVLLVKRLCTGETVSNVVENNIKEDGSEASETRISLEHESLKINLQKDTKITKQEGEDSVATSKQVLNETCAITNVKAITPPKGSTVDRFPETIPLEKTQQDEPSISSAQILNGTFSITKEMTPPKASVEDRRPETTPLEKTQQDELSISSAQVLNETFFITKGIAPPKASAENRRPETTPLKKTPEEWTCDVQHAQSGSVAGDLTGTFAAAEFKDIMPPNGTAENRCPETPLLKKAQLEWTTTSETTFNDHLQARKHMSTLDAEDKGPSPSPTIKLKDGNVAEKLIKDSGSEGKLIASKAGGRECSNSHRDVQVVESTEKNGPAISKQVQHAQLGSVARDLTGTFAAAESKDIMPPNETAENRFPETPLVKKAQLEWTTTSEITFNDHLQGHKHMSTLGAKDKGPSPSLKLKDGNVAEKLIKDSGSEGKLIASKTGRRECSNCHRAIQVVESTEKNGPAALKQVQHEESVSDVRYLKGTHAIAMVEDIMPPNKTAEDRFPETPLIKKAQLNWTTTREITFNDHLQGRKHMSKLGPKDIGPSPSTTTKLKDGNVAEKLIKNSGSEGKVISRKTKRGERSNSHGDAQVVESEEKNCPAASQQYANGEVRETTPPKAQKEWRRDLYIVRSTSEDMLKAQLRGSKLESKFESLKASKNGAFPQWCTVCDVKLESDDNVVSHFKGKKHISNMKLSQKNGEP